MLRNYPNKLKTVDVFSETKIATQVGAIIVTYRPDREKLAALLGAIANQVGAIVIVDNTESTHQVADLPLLAQEHHAQWICLGENLGIAAAQNRGIEYLKHHLKMEYVLFLDHDCLPHAGMVRALLKGFFTQTEAGYRVGAVGPNNCIPKLGTSAPFLQVGWLRTRRLYCSFANQLIATDHLISSGTLTPLSVIEEVGLFREDLFIDYVDVEWYLRVLQKGYTLWGVCAANMDHDLGDEPIMILGRPIFSHSPLRHYYLIRNGIALYQAPYLPLKWKCSDARRLLSKCVFYLLFSKPRLAHLRMMGRGLWHGITGRLGKGNPTL